MRKREELAIESLSDSAFQKIVESMREENESYDRLACLLSELETSEGAKRTSLVRIKALPKAA